MDAKFYGDVPNHNSSMRHSFANPTAQVSTYLSLPITVAVAFSPHFVLAKLILWKA